MELSKIYSEFASKPDSVSRQVLEQTHWFVSHAEFDPRSGDALPQNLSTFLHKASAPLEPRPLKDRLWRIVDHCENAVRKIIRDLNESPRREHTEMHVRYVRELDVNSFIKLSQRPGRNFRQKLANKPYLSAVRRYQSIDLPENRLLKEFVVQITELLEHRENHIGDDLGEFYDHISRWIRSETADLISKWDNPPPNNTLLSHREYRRLYDSWTWLQSLDEDLQRDRSRITDREQTKKKWQKEAQIYSSEQTLFADQPLHFNLDEFEIRPWEKNLQKHYLGKQIPARSITQEFYIPDPSCIDFSSYPIAHSKSPGNPEQLLDHFIFQRWKNDNEQIDLNLFHSDALWSHENCTTASFPQMLFDREMDESFFNAAARELSRQLRKRFNHDHLVWLTPDSKNDFQLTDLRSNINLFFSRAEPLPRSVAAVLEQIDYAEIPKDNYSVVVTDKVGGKGYAIKMVALYDEDLEKEIPETRGFVWERCPPVQVSSDKFSQNLENELPTVSRKQAWRTTPSNTKFQGDNHVIEIPDSIGEWDERLDLSPNDSPIEGGDRYLELREISDSAILWRDRIPELYISAPDNITGLMKDLELVGSGHKIKPIRGKAISIPITNNFVIPAGQKELRNPLYQGKSSEKVGYSLVVSSTDMPLSAPVDCDLELLFTYGADNPYHLKFVPRLGEIRPIIARWEKNKDEVKTVESPGFPPVLSWQSLTTWYWPEQKKEEDLSKWFENRVRILEDKTSYETTQALFTRCKSLRNRMPIIWSGKKSIHDNSCLDSIKTAAMKLAKLSDKSTNSIANNVLNPLIARMGQDANESCIRWVQRCAKAKNNHQEVGFAIASLTKHWQIQIFNEIANNPSNFTVKTFAYSIWQNEDFFRYIPENKFEKLLQCLLKMLRNVNESELQSIMRLKETALESGDKRKKWDYQQKRRQFVRNSAEPLELLLGLLRFRSTNRDAVKKMIHPNHNFAVELGEQVERIAEIYLKVGTPFHSRIQISGIDNDYRIHILFFALRQFLSGEDSSSAIRITGISDEEK